MTPQSAAALPSSAKPVLSGLGAGKLLLILLAFELLAAAAVSTAGMMFYVPLRGTGSSIARLYTDVWLPQWAYHAQIAILTGGWTWFALKLLGAARWFLGGIAAVVVTLALSALWAPLNDLGIAGMIRNPDAPLGMPVFALLLLLPAMASIWLAKTFASAGPGGIAASLVFWLALLLSGGDKPSMLQASLWAVPPMQLALPLGVAAASHWSRVAMLLGGLLLLLLACLIGGALAWLVPLPSWLF